MCKLVKMVADLCRRYSTSIEAAQVSKADFYTCRLCPYLLCLSPLSHENSPVTDAVDAVLEQRWEGAV